MVEDRFKIVFERLPGADEHLYKLILECRLIRDEVDEIAELRRLANEILMPEPKTYTAT